MNSGMILVLVGLAVIWVVASDRAQNLFKAIALLKGPPIV